jgi:hypothetical protein
VADRDHLRTCLSRTQLKKVLTLPLAIFGRRFLPDRSGSGDRYQLEGMANSGLWR